MRDEILQIIENEKYNWRKIIKLNAVYMEWIDENTLAHDADFDTTLYSALYNETNICEFGGKRKIVRFNDRKWVGCGNAKTCLCSKNKLKQNLKAMRENMTDEKQLLMNTKRKETMMSTYGYAYNSNRPEVKKILQNNNKGLKSIALLQNKDWLYNEYVIDKKSIIQIATELRLFYGTISEYCKKYGFEVHTMDYKEHAEHEILMYLNELYKTTTDRIDVQVNSLKYFADNNDMKLLQRRSLKNVMQVLDFDWINKKDIIKSIFRSKLHLNKTIYARKCKIQDIDIATEKSFLNKWHRQGYVGSTYCKGLYYDNELVMLVSICKERFNSGFDFELLRLCTKADITVTGGGSKLMTAFDKLLQADIVSYCDLAYSGTGNGYRAMGFEQISITAAGYFWTDGNTIISRYKAQNCKNWLLNYNKNIGITANMKKSDYKQFWTAGNYKFVWHRNACN